MGESSMEHVKNAIEFAAQSKAIDFKDSIYSALADKIQDAMLLKKMEIGSKILSEPEESEIEDSESSNQIDTEENVDENL